MAIARVIRELPYDRLVVAERFAAMLAEQDPRFDRNRFLAAVLWGIERRTEGGSPDSSATSGRLLGSEPGRASVARYSVVRCPKRPMRS